MNLGLEATSQRNNSPREKEGRVNLFTRYGRYFGVKFLKWLAPDGIILRPVMPSRSKKHYGEGLSATKILQAMRSDRRKKQFPRAFEYSMP